MKARGKLGRSKRRLRPTEADRAWQVWVDDTFDAAANAFAREEPGPQRDRILGKMMIIAANTGNRDYKRHVDHFIAEWYAQPDNACDDGALNAGMTEMDAEMTEKARAAIAENERTD